jgi:flagellar basal-body rod protein FlgG
MLEGLYSAGAGMEAAQEQLSAVSNNMANESTPGYQSEIVGFHDLLYTTDNDNPSSALVGAGAGAGTLGFSQAQGSLQQTGNPLDIALNGPGYFQVRQPDGSTALTRNGSFQLNSRGQLTTNLGMEMVPPITLPKGTQPSQVSISSDGNVSVGNQKIGQIKVVQVSAPDKLLPRGNSVYGVTTASGPAQSAKGVTMQQGYLEQSNVDLNTEISDMMTAQQAYNMGSRAVQMEAQLGQIAATLK